MPKVSIVKKPVPEMPDLYSDVSLSVILDMIDETFLYEKKENVSKEQKTRWLKKFFKRMSFSHYKWTIMPPSPIVDARSINKSEYVHPAIASKINYQKTTFEQKLLELKEEPVFQV